MNFPLEHSEEKQGYWIVPIGLQTLKYIPLQQCCICRFVLSATPLLPLVAASGARHGTVTSALD